MRRILRRLRNDQRGFTLLELVVAMALLTIAAPIAGAAMLSSLRATQQLSGSSEVLDELRLQVTAISRELRSAACITSPGENTSGTKLTFSTASNRLDPNAASSIVTYEVVGGELRRTQGAGAPAVVSRGIVGPATPFRQVTTPRRSVQIDFSVKLLEGKPPQHIRTVVAGRNAWRTCT
ncbi:MAG: type II secretion system GspH family protein [Actinomycetota bacterium]|nr:type II secretion system GspH family protein [Actinomycetota bacterium]